MATITIDLDAKIQAEIVTRNNFTSPNVPLILDPLSKSYSDYSPLVYYNLEFSEVTGLIDPRILNNGKNSRFTSNGSGSCIINLYIEDEQGNTDTDSIKIIVA